MLGGFVGFRRFHLRNLLCVFFGYSQFLLLVGTIFLQVLHHRLDLPFSCFSIGICYALISDGFRLFKCFLQSIRLFVRQVSCLRRFQPFTSLFFDCGYLLVISQPNLADASLASFLHLLDFRLLVIPTLTLQLTPHATVPRTRVGSATGGVVLGSVITFGTGNPGFLTKRCSLVEQFTLFFQIFFGFTVLTMCFAKELIGFPVGLASDTAGKIKVPTDHHHTPEAIFKRRILSPVLSRFFVFKGVLILLSSQRSIRCSLRTQLQTLDDQIRVRHKHVLCISYVVNGYIQFFKFILVRFNPFPLLVITGQFVPFVLQTGETNAVLTVFTANTL